MIRRVAQAAVAAVFAAVVFQFLATLVAILLTKTNGFGAPLPAGSANFAVAQRPTADAASAAIDLAVTALVFFVPAWRSLFALGGALALGIVLFAGSVVGLSNATATVSHVAWWVIAMLPALVIGLVPRTVDQ